jgi:hypothetical protein
MYAAKGIKIKAPLHSLLGGFQPKPYHNVCEESHTINIILT